MTPLWAVFTSGLIAIAALGLVLCGAVPPHGLGVSFCALALLWRYGQDLREEAAAPAKRE